MVETEDYFFFAINSDNSVVAFRSDLEFHDIVGLRDNLEKFGSESTSPEQYAKAVNSFTKNPTPLGQVMEWVCRDNPDYLNLEKYPLELTPRG